MTGSGYEARVWGKRFLTRRKSYVNRTTGDKIQPAERVLGEGDSSVKARAAAKRARRRARNLAQR